MEACDFKRLYDCVRAIVYRLKKDKHCGYDPAEYIRDVAPFNGIRK